MSTPEPTTEALIEKARERAERSCVWDEGTVPDHVARFLWDAVHDRRVLLDALSAARAIGAQQERERLRATITEWFRPNDQSGPFWDELLALLSDPQPDAPVAEQTDV